MNQAYFIKIFSLHSFSSKLHMFLLQVFVIYKQYSSLITFIGMSLKHFYSLIHVVVNITTYKTEFLPTIK